MPEEEIHGLRWRKQGESIEYIFGIVATGLVRTIYCRSARVDDRINLKLSRRTWPMGKIPK